MGERGAQGALLVAVATSWYGFPRLALEEEFQQDWNRQGGAEVYPEKQEVHVGKELQVKVVFRQDLYALLQVEY